MSLVYLGLGSNLGDRLQNITTAIVKLLSIGKLKSYSSIWETSPWGFTPQSYFLNCVTLFETALTPLELIGEVSKIEHSMGRERKQEFGPRTIDIDILFYNTLTMNAPNLIIPHPLLHRRKFVLLPLSEIAPNLMHPTLKKEIREILKELTSGENCHIFMPAYKFKDLINIPQVL